VFACKDFEFVVEGDQGRASATAHFLWVWLLGARALPTFVLDRWGTPYP